MPSRPTGAVGSLPQTGELWGAGSTPHVRNPHLWEERTCRLIPEEAGILAALRCHPFTESTHQSISPAIPVWPLAANVRGTELPATHVTLIAAAGVTIYQEVELVNSQAVFSAVQKLFRGVLRYSRPREEVPMASKPIWPRIACGLVSALLFKFNRLREA